MFKKKSLRSLSQKRVRHPNLEETASVSIPSYAPYVRAREIGRFYWWTFLPLDARILGEEEEEVFFLSVKERGEKKIEKNPEKELVAGKETGGCFQPFKFDNRSGGKFQVLRDEFRMERKATLWCFRSTSPVLPACPFPISELFLVICKAGKKETHPEHHAAEEALV